MGPLVGGLADEVMTKNYLAAAARNHVDAFIAADSDLDGTVESNELLVLVFSNIRAQMPCNRGNEPVDLNANEKINLRTAVAGPFTPFYQIAHELSHSLGTIDMYNSGAGNSMLTLMGGYSFYSDDQGTVHLDAWHKFALGWCEPRIQTLRGHGDVVVVGETSPSRPDGSVILWDPTRGSTEYFILERRSRTGVNRAYDSSVAGDGVLLWRITPGASPPVTHLGAPSGIVGGNSVWHDGQSIVPAWSDGTSTLTRLTFTSTTPDYQVRLGD
jgi:M6 family metalloprotease-like protein